MARYRSYSLESKRQGGAAKLLRNGHDGRPLRGIIPFMLEHQPHRPFPYLGGSLLLVRIS